MPSAGLIGRNTTLIGADGKRITLGNSTTPGAATGATGTTGTAGTLTSTVAPNPALAAANTTAANNFSNVAARSTLPNEAITRASGTVDARLNTLAGRENTADPYLLEQVNNLRSRLSNDPTQAAQNFAAQNIRAGQNAAHGNLEQDLAARGIMPGSGVAAELGNRIDTQALGALGQSAASIGLGRQSALDQLVLGGQGIMAAPSQYGLSRSAQTNQALGLVPELSNQASNYSLGASGLANNALGLALTGSNNLANNQLGQGANNISAFNAANEGTHLANSDALAQLAALRSMDNYGGGGYGDGSGYSGVMF